MPLFFFVLLLFCYFKVGKKKAICHCLLLPFSKIASGLKDPLSIKLYILIGHYRKKIVRPTLLDVSMYPNIVITNVVFTGASTTLDVDSKWYPLTTFKYSTLTYISFLVMVLHNSKSQVTLLLIFPVFWSLSKVWIFHETFASVRAIWAR